MNILISKEELFNVLGATCLCVINGIKEVQKGKASPEQLTKEMENMCIETVELLCATYGCSEMQNET